MPNERIGLGKRAVNAAKSILGVVATEGIPRVVLEEIDQQVSPFATAFRSMRPDESLAPAGDEMLDFLLSYANVPLVFRAVDLIAKTAAMVPLLVFESIPEAEFEDEFDLEFQVDPLQGVQAMPRPGATKRRTYKADLYNLIKSEVGSSDETTTGAKSDMAEETRDVQVGDHPMLRIMRRPNRDLTSFNLMYRTYAYMELTGNCYWMLTRDDITKEINGIFVPKPHRVEPVSRDGKKGFERRRDVNGAPDKVEFWDWNDVIHFRNFSPVSDLLGMSNLRPVIDTILTEVYATRWNKTFFQNSARPDFWIKFKDRLDPTSFRRLIQEYNLMHQGMSKTHRPGILEGGAEVEDFSANRKDMEFNELRKFNRQEILMALGVHPALVGVNDETVNADELREIRRMFWEDTMIPKMTMIAEHIELYMFPRVHPVPPGVFDAELRREQERLGIRDIDSPGERAAAVSQLRANLTPLEEELDRFHVRYDTRNVAAMRDQAIDESQVAMRYIQTGALTINEVRRDLNRPPVRWGNQPPLSTPVGSAGMMGDINEARTLTAATGQSAQREATKMVRNAIRREKRRRDG